MSNQLEPNNMRTFFLFTLAGAFFLSGCAATKPTLPAGYANSIESRGVSAATMEKVRNGRSLSYTNILDLVQHGVATSKIISYLKATRTPYSFSTGQLQRLQKAGASMDLIGYLKGSAAFYSNNPYRGHPYYSDPTYLGPPPFGWDGWGDPFFYP